MLVDFFLLKYLIYTDSVICDCVGVYDGVSHGDLTHSMEITNTT